MIYLVLIILSVTLGIGFFLLTAYEARTGVRLCRGMRERLDTHASRAFFIIAHVDLAAFLHDFVSSLGKRIVHDVAHLSLVVVRVAERLLTRAVRALRAHTAHTATQKTPTSPFVRSMSDLKHKLRNGSDATTPSEE